MRESRRVKHYLLSQLADSSRVKRRHAVEFIVMLCTCVHLAANVEGDEGLTVGGSGQAGSRDVEEAALDRLVGGRLAELDGLASSGLLAESQAGVLGGDILAAQERGGAACRGTGGGGAADVSALLGLFAPVVVAAGVGVAGVGTSVGAGVAVVGAGVGLGRSDGGDAGASLVKDHQVGVGLLGDLRSRDGVEVAERGGAGGGKAEDEGLAARVGLAKLLAGVRGGGGGLGAGLDVGGGRAGGSRVADIADGEGTGLSGGSEGNDGGDGELHFDGWGWLVVVVEKEV